MHMQNATPTYDDYVDFLTTYLSLVHVITPDDLVGTKGDVYTRNGVWWDVILETLCASPHPRHYEKDTKAAKGVQVVPLLKQAQLEIGGLCTGPEHSNLDTCDRQVRSAIGPE